MKTYLAAILGVIVLLIVAGSAFASPVAQLVTDPSTVVWNYYVDWGSHPTLGTSLSPMNATSNGGMDVTVSDFGVFLLMTQGQSGNGGNFTNGDNIIEDPFDADSIVVSFATPVYSGGAQMMSNGLGAFTGYIKAYDSSNNLLGSFSEAGNANYNADDSAIFIGVKSLTADIAKLEFSTNSGRGGVMINRLEMQAVPEPGSLCALATGLGSLAFFVRKRK